MDKRNFLKKPAEPISQGTPQVSAERLPKPNDESLGKAYIGAASAIGAGLRIIPVNRQSKKPSQKGWQNSAIATIEELRLYVWTHPDTNFGIITGNSIVVVDIDGEKGRKSLAKLEKKYGKLPPTITVSTPGGGRHLYFRYDKGDIGNSASKLAPNIDIRGQGGFVVCAGSVHPNGNLYRWENEPGDVEMAPLPKWMRKKLKKARQAVPSPTVVGHEWNIERARAYSERALELEAARVCNAPNFQRNATLNRAAFRIGQLVPICGLDAHQAAEVLTNAALEAGLEQAEITATINSGLTSGTKRPRQHPANLSTSLDLRGKALTEQLAWLGGDDIGNAHRFVKRAGDKVRWTSGRGWMVWSGTHWIRDNAGQRVIMAMEVMDAIKREAKYLDDATAKKSRRKFAKESRHKSAIERMLELARPMLAVSDDKLDADPLLLNVANGTLDLRTGSLEPHNPADHITVVCPVPYNAMAKCPIFKKVLKEACGGNKDYVRFLQKSVGYSLTGDVSEQILFFLYGPTKTAKSTFVNLIRDLAGTGYGLNTPIKTFLVKQFDNDIPNDVARLKGARIVTAIETNPGQQFDEAKIKAMTGGDKISARFMRAEWFDFDPTFKIWLAANDLPRLRATEESIWERFVLIPFNVQIPPERRDKHLPKKLRKEFEGILAWAVRGCLKWQKEGLADKVLFDAEKNRWRQKSDTVTRFYGECCQVAPLDALVPAKVMFGRYSQWCAANSEKTCSTSEFKARLIELNITHGRTKKMRFWKGIKLIK